MKKQLLLLVLSCLMLLCVSPAAQGEAPTCEVHANDVIVMEGADVFAVKGGRNPNYYLIDSSCNKIADTGVSNLTYLSHEPFLLIATEDYKEGLVDAQGNAFIPAEYDVVEIISPRWQAGIKLGPGTENDYDYSGVGPTNDYFLIKQVDFYFDGKPAGTLNDPDVKRIVDAFGSYIHIIDRNENSVWYNSSLEKSPYIDPNAGYDEYSIQREDGIYVYYHNGTGQKAFSSECTLTAEEVKNPYLYENMGVYDLQGNELFSLPYMLDDDFTFDFINGYCLAKTKRENGKYQFIIFDDKGNVVMEPSSFYAGMLLDPALAEAGYVKYNKEGRIYGYTDLSGKETFEIDNARGYSMGNFFIVDNNSDNTTSIFGPLGQIGDNYKYERDRSATAIVAWTVNGEKGAMNLFGETIIPFSSDILDIEFNDAGTAAVVKYSGGKYVIYNFAPAN